ncbi:MAG: precorrin-2 C(20)-methyltransferase [Candidatus Promineifilaceae bacterium]
MNLTAIGVGPGDPELITVKGLNALKSAEIVFVPRSKDGDKSLALRIVETYLRDEQHIVKLPLPMTRNPDLLVPAWEQAADIIAQTMGEMGATRAVYLLLGDPLLYGTFTYIWERMAQRHTHIGIQIIPGVTSFAATAAATQFILSTTNDRVAILPASYETDSNRLRDLLRSFDTVILMKAGTVLPQLLDAIDELGLLGSTVYGERVGMPEEVLVTDVTTLRGQRRPYLSLLIVRRG